MKNVGCVESCVRDGNGSLGKECEKSYVCPPVNGWLENTIHPGAYSPAPLPGYRASTSKVSVKLAGGSRVLPSHCSFACLLATHQATIEHSQADYVADLLPGRSVCHYYRLRNGKLRGKGVMNCCCIESGRYATVCFWSVLSIWRRAG